jgi:hypothetical protein
MTELGLIEVDGRNINLLDNEGLEELAELGRMDMGRGLISK